MSRRGFLVRSGHVGLMLGAGVPLLQACGSDSKTGTKKDPIASGLKPEKGPLRILNYADYVSADVIADFEKKYGVKVEISTIVTDSEATAKLATGAIKADLHHSMANDTIGNLITGGLLQPLNKSYISNFANVLPAFNDPWYDPGAAYSVPYTFFGTGIGYRADRVDPALVVQQGWDTIWNATDFKGQVSVLDDDREAFTMAMLRRGLTDINTTDQKIIDQALADVMELIGSVNVKVNIEAYKDIPEGGPRSPKRGAQISSLLLPATCRRASPLRCSASGAHRPSSTWSSMTAWVFWPRRKVRCSPICTSTSCSTTRWPRRTSARTGTSRR